MFIINNTEKKNLFHLRHAFDVIVWECAPHRTNKQGSHISSTDHFHSIQKMWKYALLRQQCAWDTVTEGKSSQKLQLCTKYIDLT